MREGGAGADGRGVIGEVEMPVRVGENALGVGGAGEGDVDGVGVVRALAGDGDGAEVFGELAGGSGLEGAAGKEAGGAVVGGLREKTEVVLHLRDAADRLKGGLEVFWDSRAPPRS